MSKVLSSKWTKAVLFTLCLVPLGYLLWLVYLEYRATALGIGQGGNLTADPIKYITHFTGDWTLRFLLITLLVTPLRNLLNRPQLTRFRRMLGLFAFFYGCLHLSIYVLDGVQRQFTMAEWWKDLLQRWYITIGMAALLGMSALAATSTAGWVRRLGYKKWQRLHRIVYGSAALGVVHYYLLVKSDVRLPVMYGAILTVLLGYRLVVWMRKPRRAAPKRVPVTAPP